MASNGIWAIACPNISKHWTGSVRRSTTAGRFRRWPSRSAIWAPSPTMSLPTSCRYSPARSGLRDVLRSALSRTAALTAAAVVLVCRADASLPLARRPGGILFLPARRPGPTSRHRPRTPARQRRWSAARLLAWRNRVSHRRVVRRVPAVADLRGCHVLVRVRTRPRVARADARGHCRALDDRHRAIDGADPRFWADDLGHGAVGGDALALLASIHAGQQTLVVCRGHRGGAHVSDHRCGADPPGHSGRVHGADRARTCRAAIDRTVDCCRRARLFPVSASVVAGRDRRRPCPDFAKT